MKPPGKTAQGNAILLPLTLLLLFFITLALASPGFELYPDRVSYYPSQDVNLLVNGSGNTGFTVNHRAKK